MQTINRDIEIPIAWSWVELVRQTVRTELAACDEALREAAIMVASELAENVVKHGVPLGTMQTGRIQLRLEDGVLQISSTNGVRDTERVERLSALLGRLAAAADPCALYLQRLRELVAVPDQPETQAGIYRIVCEGGFSLSQHYVDGVLTLRAERPV
jgi:hypothetical protein